MSSYNGSSNCRDIVEDYQGQTVTLVLRRSCADPEENPLIDHGATRRRSADALRAPGRPSLSRRSHRQTAVRFRVAATFAGALYFLHDVESAITERNTPRRAVARGGNHDWKGRKITFSLGEKGKRRKITPLDAYRAYKNSYEM